MTHRVLWPILNLYKGENLFVGISILSALLKERGIVSEAVEADGRTLARRLREGPQTILAYSTPTIYARTYLELNRKLKKEFEFLAVFGGPHPTYFPEMIEEDGVDVVCRGEAEGAMMDLVDAAGDGRPLKDIANCWVKDAEGIHRNPLRPLVQDLDALPLPDHAIFDAAIPGHIWQASILTARGCPYSCTYCFNHVFRKLYRGKGKQIRRRSVDHVLEELRALRRRPQYRFIRFVDDLFILNPDWVEEFCRRYSAEIGLPFSCMVRANHMTAAIARRLKSAGCWRVQMGVESGDEEIRNDVFKRRMGEDEILRAARIVQEAGLKLVTGNILGAPGSSFEKDLKTLALNMKIRPDYAGVTLLQPYPRTEIHECAARLGMIDATSPDIRETTVSRISSLRYPDPEEKRRVENLQKLFFLPIEWPWTLPLVLRLVRLPLKGAYGFLFSRWVNYGQYFRSIPGSVGRKTVWTRSRIYGWIVSARERISSALRRGGVSERRKDGPS